MFRLQLNYTRTSMKCTYFVVLWALSLQIAVWNAPGKCGRRERDVMIIAQKQYYCRLTYFCFLRFSLSRSQFLWNVLSVVCFVFFLLFCGRLTVIFRTLQWIYIHKHDTKTWIWRVYTVEFLYSCVFVFSLMY